ncbi:rRNA methyltransferase [Rhizocola hellebori]|uniref:rRNA methyltransferase n=1 Tax=Rhizocola hellebori TaxID=1392758 RepID=A0A8J3Q9D6_9ACTN|nr:TrmH family RNA methyltransferase [Rhizocola hellebori]GIH05747.1 rRNA methyltransferase [Rhizocola hellebori]
MWKALVMGDVIGDWEELSGSGEQAFLDGFHPLKHALRFEADLRLMITDDKRGVLALAAKLAPDIAGSLDRDLVELPAREFVQLVPRPHVTRVASLARRPARAQLREALYHQPRLTPTIVLENPRNLGNVGAVVRLAAGFAATGVMTTGTIDPWHPQVIRGSAGLHFATAVVATSVTDLPEGPLFALDPDGDDIRSLTFPGNGLLAFGSERQGISPELRQRADRLVAIPMRARVSSYNLATSVAMTLFHWASGGHDGSHMDVL